MLEVLQGIYIYYETKAINSSCKEGNGCRILLLIKRNSRSTEFESVEEKYESNYLKCTLLCMNENSNK